jgi:undecaprenyl-diphosphatase
MSASSIFAWADGAEHRMCLIANAACRRHAIRGGFRIVSRLGDGVFWYVLIATMPLWVGLEHLRTGLIASMQMLLAAAFGATLYKILKNKLVRERPFIGLTGIECAMAPLDRYSFPSGHTLHAVLFTTIAISHAPNLVFALLPFTLLVAASRVVLGLHYPSDVIVGAFLGWTIAKLSTLGQAAFYIPS